MDNRLSLKGVHHDNNHKRPSYPLKGFLSILIRGLETSTKYRKLVNLEFLKD